MLKAFQDALSLLAHLDSGVLGIVLVSLQVSLSALLIGTLLGLPIGALLATEQFNGKKTIIVALSLGVSHVVSLRPPRSLGMAFYTQGHDHCPDIADNPLNRRP